MPLLTVEATFTIEVEVVVKGDFTPEQFPKYPSPSDEVGDPGWPEEIEITSISAINIQEAQFEPIAGKAFGKKVWKNYNILPQLLKFMTLEDLDGILFQNNYLRELAFDAISQVAKD